MAALLLKQSKIPSAFLATQACRWLMFNFAPTRTPDALQRCLYTGCPPAHTGEWGYSCPDSGLAPSLAEPPKLPARLFLSWSLWMAARLSGISATPPSSHICVICKLAEGTLCPIIWNADGDFEQN